LSIGADPRSRKIALVADSLLPKLLDRLDADGYGVIQLPPSGLDAETVTLWLEQVAEHVAEFLRNGYEIVLADDGTCAEALGRLGVGPLPRYR
jgi:hypothetical protein